MAEVTIYYFRRGCRSLQGATRQPRRVLASLQLCSSRSRERRDVEPGAGIAFVSRAVLVFPYSYHNDGNARVVTGQGHGPDAGNDMTIKPSPTAPITWIGRTAGHRRLATSNNLTRLPLAAPNGTFQPDSPRQGRFSARWCASRCWEAAGSGDGRCERPKPPGAAADFGRVLIDVKVYLIPTIARSLVRKSVPPLPPPYYLSGLTHTV
jgi:hypothetical protein